MSNFILSIDQGTTGTTVNIIDESGRSRARVNEEYPQIFPKPGWVEHNPEDIWSSVVSTLRKALDQARVGGDQIAAIGITNQRETVVIWDRSSGKPQYNAIVWQCRRTTDYCESLKKRGLGPTLYRKTGLVIDPYFSASKFRWILKNVSGLEARARCRELAGGTIDSFLIYRLTGGRTHATDVSNASRTQLLNLKTAKWDPELLKIFSVPASLLPEVRPSSGDFGVTRSVPGLPDGIPIRGVAGDQQAALFGQSCFRPGEGKCTYGTGSFILFNTGSQPVFSKRGLLSTIAWQLPGQKSPTYALEGGAFICGAAVQWLRDQMKFFSSSAEVESLARSVPDSGGVEFVPALTGLGAPYWDPEARGTIGGITRGTQRAHLARATLEAMALQNVDILQAMEKDAKKKIRVLKVDGGAAANDLLMQMQADFLGARISRPKMIETTSAGAAYLAGLGVGLWPDLKAIEKIWQEDRVFSVQMKPAQRKRRLESWHKAVARALF